MEIADEPTQHGFRGTRSLTHETELPVIPQIAFWYAVGLTPITITNLKIRSGSPLRAHDMRGTAVSHLREYRYLSSHARGVAGALYMYVLSCCF